MSPVIPRRIRLLPVLSTAALLAWSAAGCAGDAPPDVADPSEPALERCAEPRPQMCTKEYRPVCGHACDAPPCAPEERRTFGNACTACSHASVRAVSPGVCDDGTQAGPPPRP